MKLAKDNAVRQDWDQVKSWNYKLPQIMGYKSLVYAELDGDHGEVHTNNLERIYYILEGEGDFVFNNQSIHVSKTDVITIPPNTKYNYHPVNNKTLKIILFMELWDN